MPRLAALEKTLANIAAYHSFAALQPVLADRAPYVRSWYADRGLDGVWRFGPSKFIGYDYASADDYIADAGGSGDRDGRETERLLSQWYSVVDPASALGRNLHKELATWLASIGQRPNALARISVPKALLDQERNSAKRREVRDSELVDRISVDPTVCGGRPCIRGTRIRVTDILEMLAHGVDREEILRDYDHLSTADISAALAYAAQTTDHRIVRAT